MISRPRWIVLVAACAALLLGATPAKKAKPPATPPAVQLVESVPVETQLGNPELPRTHAVWLEMIRGAKQSLDFEQMYLSSMPGEPMDDILVAIAEAGRRGVRVRLLLDANMYRTYPQPADSFGLLPGIQVRRIFMRPIAGGIQHAKYFLVDGKETFLGSQNFDWRALKHIHELGVRIRSPRVNRTFQEVFDLDWRVAGEQMAGRDSAGVATFAALPALTPRGYPALLANAPGDTVALWPSYSPHSFIPDTTRWDLDAIIDLLDTARHEVVVQLLSYSPKERGEEDDAIDSALRRAAGRGVKVKLLISDWESDSPRIQELQKLSQVANVEAKLGTVPEWSRAYIPFARVEHSKYVVADSLWTWVGTSNWEPGYFHSSRNLGVTMKNKRLALQARVIFEKSWTAPGAGWVRADSVYTPKIHRMEPPPGRTAYGR